MGRRRFRENDVSEGRCFRETYISATLGNISIAETSFSRKHQSLKISHVISQKYKSEDQSSWKKMVRGRQTKIFKTFIKTLIKTTRWTSHVISRKFKSGDRSSWNKQKRRKKKIFWKWSLDWTFWKAPAIIKRSELSKMERSAVFKTNSGVLHQGSKFAVFL